MISKDQKYLSLKTVRESEVRREIRVKDWNRG